MLSVIRWMWLLACCLVLSGCWPSGQVPLDEQKESNFLAGKSRAQDRDFDGAIEAFEKSLEVNPHSASAHFELALIYDQQKADYAAALFHYEKARRLRPNAYPADMAKDRMEGCKRELAKTVTQTPTMEYMQRELDRLMLENQKLRQALQEWQNYYHGRSTTMPTSSVAPPMGPLVAQTISNPPPGRADRSAPGGATAVRGPSANTASPRTHKVASGDTPARIASQYGIKVSALRAANPSMDDRRLRVGQVLTIPAAGSP